MKTKKVMVLPYDRAWETAFAQIKTEITQALGDLAIAIEHVGSTSVEGMSAKPCIDLDVVIAEESLLGEVVAKLGEIGYIHEGDLGIPGREAFRYTEKPHLMKHHLYVCTQDSEELRRHVTFREFLKATPQAAEQYSKTKETAAKLFPDDIDGYIAYKAPCIEELYARCGLNDHEAEVRERWGDTQAFREHTQKTKQYAKEKWSEVNDGLMAIFAEIAACKDSGVSADSAEAQALVAKLQAHITANYYTCTDEILAGLGKMYALDERFKKNIDKYGERTAEFAAEGIRIYVENK